MEGNYKARRGIEVGSISLHPQGIPHGPHPGTVELSLGKTFTDELAVMCDTFRPLLPTQAALDLDDSKYPASWQGEHFPGLTAGQVKLNGVAAMQSPGKQMPMIAAHAAAEANVWGPTPVAGGGTTEGNGATGKKPIAKSAKSVKKKR